MDLEGKDLECGLVQIEDEVFEGEWHGWEVCLDHPVCSHLPREDGAGKNERMEGHYWASVSWYSNLNSPPILLSL